MPQFRPSSVGRALFWLSGALILYTYTAFPALLWARARLAPRPYIRAPITPTVTVIVAAHNEAAVIRGRLENLATLEYPAHLLEIVVVSDGSTDATDALVSSFPDPRIRLLSLARGGKAHALNTAVREASGEILVFTDANTIFDPQAIRALVSPFADPTVGGVAGDQRYLAPDGSRNEGEQAYWNLDRMLKVWESAAGNVVHATGAIYAIRRPLYRPIPQGLSDDFVTSAGVIAQGHRLVFARDAVAYEPVAATAAIEFGRKVRIGTRMLRSELHLRGLLNPARHGFYAIELLSHKPLRRLMAFPVVGILLSSIALWREATFYRVTTVGQVLFYAIAVLGLLRPHAATRFRTLRLPAYFCMTYAAQLIAVWNLLRGHTISVWSRNEST